MEANCALVGETQDPNGARIVLLRRVWRQKISVNHPEIAMLADAVLCTVAAPDHAAVDPACDDRARFYRRGVGPSAWLVVVVSYEQTPARIVTAFANRKDPPRWNE